ncbi:MAG: HD domain-containing protein [Clostridia bacterium]|nr:HD domain-containing protein [Clostridia bacterium]
MKVIVTQEEIDKIFDFYQTVSKLKNIERTGWNYWGLSGVRVESVAEHSFCCCVLAVSILSIKDFGIDVNKVIAMLMLHDFEESVMGDITYFDKAFLKKEQLAEYANKFLFYERENGTCFLDLIKEFNENKTKEALFARQIDKFQSDLEAFYYDEHFDLSKAEEKVLNDKQIIEFKEQGFSKVSQFFLQHDKKVFDKFFLQLVEKLEKMEEE